MGFYLFFTFSLPKLCFRPVKVVQVWLIFNTRIGLNLTEIGMFFGLHAVRISTRLGMVWVKIR